MKKQTTYFKRVNVFPLLLFYNYRPVRMRMTLNTNMELAGLREPYKATYKVRCKIPPHLTGLLALVF